MAMPSTVITRIDLSSTFTEFNQKMSRQGFIGPKVLRPRMVGIQAADVGKIPIEALLQQHDTNRASGSGYNRGDWNFTKYSYSCSEHGWEEPLDDRNIKIYQDIFDAEAIAAGRAEDIVMRDYEFAVASAVFSTSTFSATSVPYTGGGSGTVGGQYVAGTANSNTGAPAKWTAQHTATPIEDVEYARRMVILGSGLLPNAVILSRNAFWNAVNTDEIVLRLKYSGHDDPKDITENMMAEVWQVEHVLVAGGIYNQANEGQSLNAAFIWGDSYAMVARVAETDDPREPCLGRTFMWADDGPGAPGTGEEIAVLVEEYREESRRGSVLRARNDRDIELMYPQAGCLITGLS